MTPIEVFEYGKVVHQFIKENPLVTRGLLNTHYNTSSNDRRNQKLTFVLEALLAYRYIFKHTDDESAQVSFWVAGYPSTSKADNLVELKYSPVDVFGKRPVVAPPPAPSPVEPEEETPSIPLIQSSSTTQDILRAGVTFGNQDDINKVLEAQANRLKGGLHQIYVHMMSKPLALFDKNDPGFVELGYAVADRARFLGRLFGMGVIRRLKDPVDKRVAYYTLLAECPASLREDTSVSEAPATPPAPQVKAAILIPAAEETRKEVAMLKLSTEADSPNDKVEDKDESYTPAAFLGNQGIVVLMRSNGNTDEFDLEESSALIELFLMTNHEALSQRLSKMKAAQ